MNSIANIHIYNDQTLIIKYQERSTGVEEFIFNKTLLDRKKIRLCFALENDSKKLVFNFHYIFYLQNSLYNLVSLTYLNNSNIFYNNKNKILYYCKTRKILAQAKQ